MRQSRTKMAIYYSKKWWSIIVEGEEVKIVLMAQGLKALETIKIWKLQQENTGVYIHVTSTRSN
jgi:hypothetical protein